MTERITVAGGQVHRPAGWWSPAVHALLGHLRANGFPGVPEPLALDDRTETLSFVPGESGPDGWAKVVPEDGLRSYARFLRRFHDASRGFVAPAGTRWAFTDRPGRPEDVICHGDFGPWNVIWDGPEPTGLIDFDFAEPGDPLHDVAYAICYSAPFRDDDEAMRWLRYPAPPDRPRRIAVFAGAYGLDGTAGLVDAVIDRQRLDLDHVRALAARGVQPQTTWVTEGYLDELAARVAWSRAHRHLLE